MTLITELPCEIVACILRNLDDLRSLMPALLTCRYFYSSFKQNHGIEASILRQQVTPALLPFAAAALYASYVGCRRESSDGQVLLEILYDKPTHLVDWVLSLSAALHYKIARLHDAIHSLATDFASEAWDRAYPGSTYAMSPTEYFRFCRSFYRVEIFSHLFCGAPGNIDGAFERKLNSWFFSRHPPWENEQLGCVHQYLEAKLNQTIQEVNHDVKSGGLSTDYYITGEDSGWQLLWLPRGIDFIHTLIESSSYDTKKSLVKWAFRRGQVRLPEVLSKVLAAYSNNGRHLREYSSEELDSIWLGNGNGDDLEKGPYEAWRYSHAELPAAACITLVDTAWYWDRAYVFWDWRRIHEHGLLQAF